jgi:hypothetical protein
MAPEAGAAKSRHGGQHDFSSAGAGHFRSLVFIE